MMLFQTLLLERVLNSELLFVILGMAIAAFVIVKGAKLLSRIKVSKRDK
ncbi:hypothetical protein [Polaribacter sp. IC073]|nr:hypothetical protein [Polaribacter sp. IC073]